MKGIENQFHSIEQAANQYLSKQGQVKNTDALAKETAFEEILRKKRIETKESSDERLTFSKHASERLESRNINLSTEQVERLNKGVEQAREKSIRESLVMMDNIAFIVNVKNATVITALEQGGNESNVFTNIDGVVIL